MAFMAVGLDEEEEEVCVSSSSAGEADGASSCFFGMSGWRGEGSKSWALGRRRATVESPKKGPRAFKIEASALR